MTSPEIRLISRDNGVGLTRDLALMADVLRTAGMAVEQVGFGSTGMRTRFRTAGLWGSRLLHGKVPVQIFSERVYTHCLPLASRNLLVPNPEWLLPKWLPLLPRFEAVLCKTHHAERIFRALGCRTRFIGFTSEDRHDAGVVRRRAFFHLAGRSSAKGTQVVLEAWRRHPEWPLLTVVQNPRKAREKVQAPNIDHRVEYLDDAQLRELQNAHQFHLCPSETEGFGHYLMEAMSVGAVTLTTDAEPMNELVSTERGVLIPPVSSRRRQLASYYYVDVAAIETAVEQVLVLPETRLAELSARAREYFVLNDQAFSTRFCQAVMPHMAEEDAQALAVQSAGVVEGLGGVDVSHL
jgi:glycosyltransferase involved in cell wall biosynthesis